MSTTHLPGSSQRSSRSRTRPSGVFSHAWLPNVRRRRSSTARTSSRRTPARCRVVRRLGAPRGLHAQPQPTSPSADDRGAASARDTPWPRASTAPRSARRQAARRGACRHPQRAARPGVAGAVRDRRSTWSSCSTSGPARTPTACDDGRDRHSGLTRPTPAPPIRSPGQATVATPSTRDELEVGVEPPQVVRVAGDDEGLVASGKERDAGLGDIRCPGKAPQRTRCSRLVQVQVLYVKESGPHESGEACLPGAVAPDLPDSAGRQAQRSAVFRREFDDSAYASVIAFKGHHAPTPEDFRGSSARRRSVSMHLLLPPL